MKWHNRDIIPQREATLILARFEEDKLKDLQIGRAQYFEGEFQIWSNDRESCHHGQILPKKFTHWAYEDEYWKLLEAAEKEYSSNNYKKDMNTKHYTSIEQSKKLLELGLNPESADMYYFLDQTPLGNIYIPSLMFIEKHLKSRMPEYDKGDIPCWSLGALLKVMPNQITYSDFKPFPLGVFKGNKEEHSKYGHYWIQYFATDFGGAYVQTNGYSPIEAAFNMVVWLLENGYIKKV